jgi:hypothetical protein
MLGKTTLNGMTGHANEQSVFVNMRRAMRDGIRDCVGHSHQYNYSLSTLCVPKTQTRT